MNYFTQALCWEYYSKLKNLVVIQFIKYPNFEFKSWKKTWKMSESGGFFQVFTHDNYELTNDSQLYFFLHKHYGGNTTANQIIKYYTLQRS